MERTERAEMSRPCRVSRKPAIRGVRKTPSRFDAEALHSAAGTLPPATDVKAIEDCTVEGNAVSRISPAQSGSGSKFGASRRAVTPSSGNSANVLRNTIECNRQCRAPRRATSGESCAPCMKNSSAMAASVSQPTATAGSPRAGITEAKATVSRNRGEELVDAGPDGAEQRHLSLIS